MFTLILDTIIIIILTICLFGLYHLYSDNIKLLISQPIKFNQKKKEKGDKSTKCSITHDYGFEKFKISTNKESNDIVKDFSSAKHETNDNIEAFELDQDSIDRKKYESKLCKFKDDTGWICPIHYNEKGMKILPYQECSNEIQEEVCKYLLDEWDEEAKIDTLDDTHHYITRNWHGGDILYVLIKNKNNKKENNELLGFVAIDRKQFYPFVSHIYIIPSKRKNGYGKLLLEFSIEYTKALEFTECRLWCESKLVSYYEKNGWKVIDEKNPKAIVMVKYI